MLSTLGWDDCYYVKKRFPIHPLNGTECSFSSRVPTKPVSLRYRIPWLDNHDFLHFTILFKEAAELILRGSLGDHPNKEFVFYIEDESLGVPFWMSSRRDTRINNSDCVGKGWWLRVAMIVCRSTQAANSMIAVCVSRDCRNNRHDTLVFILACRVTIQLGINDLHANNVPEFTKVVFHLPQYRADSLPHLHSHRLVVCSQEWRFPYSSPQYYIVCKRNVS